MTRRELAGSLGVKKGPQHGPLGVGLALNLNPENPNP